MPRSPCSCGESPKPPSTCAQSWSRTGGLTASRHGGDGFTVLCPCGGSGLYRRRVPRTVLLVEDEPDLIQVMERALRRAGLDVVVARSGAQAVQITRSRHIDVVTVDRGLPDMDGTVVTAQMRAGGFRGGILVTSGHSGREHVDACRSAGADGVLCKPFALSELVGRVAELFGAAEAVQAPSPSLVRG